MRPILIRLGFALLAAFPALASEGLRPVDFGARADGVADDTAALQMLAASASPGMTVDLGSGVYRISAPIFARPGVTYRGGKIKWTFADPLRGAFVAADDSTFVNISFVGSGAVGTEALPLYQIAIDSGATSRGSAPANRVTVRDCLFENMTVGIAVGGDAGDLSPNQWRVIGNTFKNIAGYTGTVAATGIPGQSEGYGIVYASVRDGEIANNTFYNITRHAIYISAGSRNVTVSHNKIDGIDNIAIQLNTYLHQPITNNILIYNNIIYNMKKSTNYKYPSSVGIGIYGQFSNIHILRNMILGAQDIGIRLEAQSDPSRVFGQDVLIADNEIWMSLAPADAAIRLDDVDDVLIVRNRAFLGGASFGVAISSNGADGSKAVRVVQNHFETMLASTILARVDLHGRRLIDISHNSTTGFNQYNLLRQTPRR